jgi:hypothetical protein
MNIDYVSEGFPSPGPVTNGSDSLSVTWDDLLWAAVTVGRPSRYYAFRHGTSSLYEALFRISALRMTVEQSSPKAWRLRRTPAARSLDPSEKGAVNYFLGLTLCKLFAEKCLDAPWLLHLDVFRDRLNPGLLSGRSRPDLVGRTRSGEWVGMESKGRVSPPSAPCKDKAKQQAERLFAIKGKQVKYRIGAFAYFKDEVLRFFWRDPQPDGVEPPNPIRLDITEADIWKAYYLPILEIVKAQPVAASLADDPISIKEADLGVRVVPEVMRLLSVEKWKEAGHWCLEHKSELAQQEAHGDGVKIVAGQSWTKPFEDRVE